MCKIFRDKLAEKTKLSLSIQTNATLIDDDWIELFQTHEIAVGVSIDGPKIYNDQYRIDHRGKGTYDRLKIGIDKLFDACKKNKIKEPAALSVVNPNFSATLIYEHLVYDLGFKVLDFLLPDLSYQTISKIESEKINSFLLDLIYAWKKQDDPSIHIRILDSIVKKLLTSLRPKPTIKTINQIISISTNGHVVPNDILRNTQFWNDKDEFSILENSLFDIVNSELFTFLRQSEATIPKNCTDCC
ncbi:hypothetical protein CC99x_003470 [Candidatus Berkiella cookevillensis]|uniref:Radical SAM core domain-containing protein n=1 Tax=Candidatus Berkiella cookevillensis TaxID=437022 RepID=A0A0Q9YCL0_9GAMM|nr:radical SAM protein [Candidatus Berkiella cookevillensis]MCS5707957.1 hypothetical protein [Candidatus Berkiella cookevillensis]